MCVQVLQEKGRQLGAVNIRGYGLDGGFTRVDCNARRLRVLRTPICLRGRGAVADVIAYLFPDALSDTYRAKGYLIRSVHPLGKNDPLFKNAIGFTGFNGRIYPRIGTR